jgi:hypothetical protein
MSGSLRNLRFVSVVEITIFYINHTGTCISVGITVHLKYRTLNMRKRSNYAGILGFER